MIRRLLVCGWCCCGCCSCGLSLLYISNPVLHECQFLAIFVSSRQKRSHSIITTTGDNAPQGRITTNLHGGKEVRIRTAATTKNGRGVRNHKFRARTFTCLFVSKTRLLSSVIVGCRLSTTFLFRGGCCWHKSNNNNNNQNGAKKKNYLHHQQQPIVVVL